HQLGGEFRRDRHVPPIVECRRSRRRIRTLYGGRRAVRALRVGCRTRDQREDTGGNIGRWLRVRSTGSPMRADVMQKIRFGVLSTAHIGVQKVIPAMQKGKHTEVVAIASRSLDKARDMARHLGIPRWYGSYEALLADADVDAVYNPLPNDQHVPWSMRALEAGKHRLCEEPIGPSSAPGPQLVQGARRPPPLKNKEGLLYRHHPPPRPATDTVQTRPDRGGP